jgi:hypothetical protein
MRSASLGQARAALARGLVGQVAHYPGGLPEPAGACGQGRNQTGPGLGTEVRPPRRRERVLSAQSASIDAVSGATYTSEAYAQSLQAALDALHMK